jgi:hypothetical protein
MRLTSTGLGIGTSSPAYKLHVNGNSLLNVLEIGEMSGFLSNSTNAAIGWASGFTGYTNGTLILQPRSSTATPIVFATGATSADERMRITSAGDVGIGTSSPVGKLHVNGVGYFGNTGASDTQLRLGPLDASNTYLQAVSGDGTTAKGIVFYAGSATMTYNSSGNLGLGVTPANWASGRVALQIGNTPYIIGPNIELGSNFYVNSGYKYIATGEATSYEQNAGSHKWKTAASGTAGNAITFTQAATLDASGNFMVGVTSTSFRMNATVASGADKDIFAAQISGASNGLTVKWNHSTTTTRVNIANLPTSSAGLAAGDLYNDSGTLKVA